MQTSAIFLLLLLAHFATCQQQTVVIGALDEFDVVRRCMEIAAERASTPTHLYKIVTYDTRGNVSAAKVYAEKIFSEHGAVGIIGPWFSSMAFEIEALTRQYNKPMISYSATVARLSLVPTFLRLVPTTTQYAEAMVDLLFTLNQFSNVGLYYTNEFYGADGLIYVTSYAREKGINITVTAMATLNPDVNRERLALFKDCPAVVAFIQRTQSADLVLRQINELGIKDKIWIFPQTFTGQYATLSNKMNAEDLLFYEQAEPLWKNDQYLLSRLGTKTYHPYCGTSHDAVLTFAAAISRMPGTTYKSGAALIPNLKGVDFVGVSGRVRYTSSGNRVGVSMLVRYDDLRINFGRNIVNGKETVIGKWNEESSVSVSSDVRYGINRTMLQTSLVPRVPGFDNRWNILPSAGPPPSPRIGASFVHLAVSDRLVVFGGEDSVVKNDLWYYDVRLQQWIPQLVFELNAPLPRKHHVAWAYSTSHFIFGGFDNFAFYNDLWQFSFSLFQWIQETVPTSPSPRRLSGVATLDTQTYLFGGQDIRADTNDLWRFDNPSKRWTEVVVPLANRPAARNDHCVAPRTAKGPSIVVFGGTQASGAILNDLHIFNTNSSTWTRVNTTNSPNPRKGHVCSVINDTLFVMFGSSEIGSETIFFNDMYSIYLGDFVNASSLLSWKKVATNIPPRYQSDVVQFWNYIVWFSGQTSTGLSNDLWQMQVVDSANENFDLVQVSTLLQPPPAFAAHTLSRVGGDLYLFGGRSTSSRTNLYNQVYSYNLESKLWRLIPSSTLPPIPRQYHAATTVADAFLLFGGLSEEGESLSDLWMFSTIKKSWKLMPLLSGSTSPPPRYSHVLTYNGTHLIAFGGRNQATQFTDMYAYNLNLQVWSLVQPVNSGPSRGVSCAISSVGVKFFLSGCSDLAGNIHSEVFQFDTTTLQWSIFTVLPFAATSTEHDMKAVSDEMIFIFGGNRKAKLFNLLYKVTRTATERVALKVELRLPLERAEHKMEFYADQILLYGGTGTITTSRIKILGRIFGELYEYRLGPICSTTIPSDKATCIKCSVGSYEFNGVCLKCLPGYYNDVPGSTSCIPCRPGFFNSIEGASTPDYCLPCPFGSYSAESGSAVCKPCPENAVCFIGSSKFTNASSSAVLQTTPYITSSQPHLRPTSDQLEARIQLYATLGLGIFMIVLLATLITMLWFGWINAQWIIFCDRYSERHNKSTGVMKRWKNKLGGLFSIVAFGLILLFASLSLSGFLYNNLVEVRSVIPNAITDQTKFEAKMDISVKAIGYSGSCVSSGNVCAAGIQVAASFCRNYTLSCARQNAIGDQLSNCSVTLVQGTCAYNTLTDTGIVLFTMQEELSYALAYEVTSNASSGYNNELSSITFHASAPNNFFFKGVHNPSTAAMQVVPTSYLVAYRSNTPSYGFHLDFLSFKSGDIVDWTEFNVRKGLAFQILFQKAQYTLDIILSEKRVWTRWLADTLGQLAGAFAAIGACLSIIESIMHQIKKAARVTPAVAKFLTGYQAAKKKMQLISRGEENEKHQQLIEEPEEEELK